MRIEQKGNSVLIHEIYEKPIKIPSQMYPLSGSLNFITHDNTEPFPEGALTDCIQSIYDSIEPGIGTCYTNAKRLTTALTEKGIECVSFVGWVFIGGALPVHHCFTVIDKHILDFNLNPSYFFTEEYKDIGLEKARDKLTDMMVSLKDTPNSQKSTFGQVSPYSLYIASPCKPDEGLKLYQKLMKAYPKHPCYTNLTEKHMSKTQEMLLKKKG